MNFGTLYKVFDTAVTLGTAASRIASAVPRESSPSSDTGLQPPAPGVRGYLEARLTNVLAAALKEAFDRDHARLELERAALDEQRSRAERALQMELWRQAADREIGRLKLLAAAALAGWFGAVIVLVARLDAASVTTRGVMALAWLLLLGAFGTSFTAQGRISAFSADASAAPEAGRLGVATLWLLIAGLALAAGSLLV